MVANFNLDSAMRCYLGASETGGYQPIGGDARLREAYGAEWQQVREALRGYLSRMNQLRPDWATETLIEALHRVQAWLSDAMPEFSETTRLAMANCWAFGWK